METQNISAYDFIQVCNTLDVDKKANEKWKLNEFSEETKKTIYFIIDKFLLEISLEASKLTLFSLVNNNRSLTMELFSQNIEEYIYLTVTQSVTTSYNEGLEKMIREISEVLIKNQDGLSQKNPEPFDLKFQLKNGEEYCIDIKSVNDQKFHSKQKKEERMQKAEKAGSTYRLCLYDDESISDEAFMLNGNDFWKLVAGFDNAKSRIYRLINGAANKLSVSSIIRETKNRFIAEWKMQE